MLLHGNLYPWPSRKRWTAAAPCFYPSAGYGRFSCQDEGFFGWKCSGGWFQRFVIFTPIWGNDPIWLIFFRWVKTVKTRNGSLAKSKLSMWEFFRGDTSKREKDFFRLIWYSPSILHLDGNSSMKVDVVPIDGVPRGKGAFPWSFGLLECVQQHWFCTMAYCEDSVRGRGWWWQRRALLYLFSGNKRNQWKNP